MWKKNKDKDKSKSGGWVEGWGGAKVVFKDCLQQSKTFFNIFRLVQYKKEVNSKQEKKSFLRKFPCHWQWQ